mmetsp:Transcript_2924/g.6700  ORF Transcript_2924/g.6700 Transcript_2924/m.6700 type:complete len:114 (-) Transcript_2924:618-959(-)|eukprot:CAMPEP_0178994912 /NCGR_PEP_ID=MMETSP0795-20121207/7552_1 /TAXON_ID=88552 /ORGANISM="Amoebophrya sp., Strain Ameob2" /LENGTH=113 /DNA_ID=CAMNT_0020687195 /DNA_START=226 /DNA_END=567 /DNA_ORIENTATION=-
MPPASGVGITSIPRQCDFDGNLKQCSQFHKQSNCNKPSQKPAVTKVRDAQWIRKKPDLFFNSARYLQEVERVKANSPRGEPIELPKKPGVSSTASACAGGSTYTEVLMRQMGY